MQFFQGDKELMGNNDYENDKNVTNKDIRFARAFSPYSIFLVPLSTLNELFCTSVDSLCP